MTWDDNGAAECAPIIIGNAIVDSTQIIISVSATTVTGLRVGITVLHASGLTGTYSCEADASVNDLYVDFTYSGGDLRDCTIAIDSPGAPGSAPATGTFSATLTDADGGVIDLTNGTFNTPVFLPPP
jgi:hypothetical protein